MPSCSIDFAAGLSDARILVTGGSGFIGTNLVTAYARAGIPVLSVDIAPPRDSEHHAVWLGADVNHLDDIRSALAHFRPTHVYHLAARTDLDGKTVRDYSANVHGVTNVLSAVQGAGHRVQRIIVASSRLVCPIGYQPQSDEDVCPTTAYGESKVETERLVRSHKTLPWMLVRPTSIWGPWFGVPYRDFFTSVVRGRYVHPAGHEIRKSFGFVGNTTWQLHRLMTAHECDVLGHTFYLADDPPIEVGAFARAISAAAGRKPPRKVPISILRGMAHGGDLLRRFGLPAPLTAFRLNNLLTPMMHDLEDLMRLVGPLPYGETDGIAQTLAWMSREGLVGQRP